MGVPGENGWRGGWRLLLALTLTIGLLGGVLPQAQVARAATYTCDEAGLNAGIAAGGTVVLSCTAPTTILITSTKTIARNTVIDGGGLLTIDGNNARQIFVVASGVTASISNMTIMKGVATVGVDGAGIKSAGTLTVTGVVIRENGTLSGNGAGIYSTGSLTVTNSEFTENNAANEGGAIYSSGALAVTNSTFYLNYAGVGGGIFSASGNPTITNSTFYYNTGTIEGGALYNAGGNPTISNSTSANNSAGNNTGSFYVGAAGTLTVSNTIVGGNDSCTLYGGATVVDNGGNLQYETRNGTSCGFSGSGIAANLFSGIADNGGPTRTVYPNPSSPAISRGVAANCPATDQRGFARPTGANCTSGAVERGTVLVPTLTSLASTPDPVVVGVGNEVTLTLTGANFVPGFTAVKIKSTAATNDRSATTVNGGPIKVTVTSPTELTATLPIFPTGTAGDYSVTVTDTPLTGAESSALTLTVLAVAPSPSPLASPSPSPLTSPSASPSAAPSALPSASPSAFPSASPATSPSPSPIPATVTVLASVGGGNGTVTPAGRTAYAAGSLVTYTAIPAGGQVFLGWTLDNQPVGHASPLDFTVNADRVLVATFAPEPTFGDVPRSDPAGFAIAELTARGIINGYGDGTYGPGDTLKRAQVAALLVRALGWSGETPADPNPFTDLGAEDAELRRAVAILAGRGIAKGYGDGTFGPFDPVTHAQAISIITRSMVQAGHWQAVTAAEDDGTRYPNIPAASDHRLDILTFVKYAGAIPDRPVGQPWTNWEGEASRGWMAQVLWQAYSAVFGIDRVP